VESRGLGDDATPRRPRAREKAGDVRATALGLTWKRRHGDLLGKKMVLRRFWDWAVPDGRAKRERERERVLAGPKMISAYSALRFPAIQAEWFGSVSPNLKVCAHVSKEKSAHKNSVDGSSDKQRLTCR
jgi:hypothetical protein